MKKITVAITVDDNMGIAFNKRRQSRDKLLIKDLVNTTTGQIYISSYSAPLFTEYEGRIEIVENPIAECPDGACCFIEMTEIAEYKDLVSELIIYHWNRLYPSDKKLDLDIQKCGLKIAERYEFAGNSHDVITKETYK